MKDEKDKYEGKSGKPAKNLRRDRLKQALRENLKRRKTQARARDDFVVAPSNAENATPYDGIKKGPSE
jgi:hypothetical protein